jgi:hypothetical protein
MPRTLADGTNKQYWSVRWERVVVIDPFFKHLDRHVDRLWHADHLKTIARPNIDNHGIRIFCLPLLKVIASDSFRRW